jgi:hypothetical protein
MVAPMLEPLEMAAPSAAITAPWRTFDPREVSTAARRAISWSIQILDSDSTSFTLMTDASDTQKLMRRRHEEWKSRSGAEESEGSTRRSSPSCPIALNWLGRATGRISEHGEAEGKGSCRRGPSIAEQPEALSCGVCLHCGGQREREERPYGGVCFQFVYVNKYVKQKSSLVVRHVACGPWATATGTLPAARSGAAHHLGQSTRRTVWSSLVDLLSQPLRADHMLVVAERSRRRSHTRPHERGVHIAARRRRRAARTAAAHPESAPPRPAAHA